MPVSRKLVSEALALSVHEREELVQTLLASFEEEGACELSADELAELDQALADADRAAKRGELMTADELLEQMRRIE